MISVAEASGGFSALTRMYKRLVDEFIGQLRCNPSHSLWPPPRMPSSKACVPTPPMW